MLAIEQLNSDYLLNKGAKHYGEGNYEDAVKYYRVAATLGNMQAVCNLGYCYMYERSVPKDMELAVALFKVAANAGIIDACAKLVSLYESDEYGLKDDEMAIYYTEAAIGLLDDFCGDFCEYPSLCLSYAKMRMPGGSMPEDLDAALKFINFAVMGFESKVNKGQRCYTKQMLEAKRLRKQDIFKGYFYLTEDTNLL